MHSDFRRSVAADTKKKNGGSGKSFYERFRFPKDTVTAALILRGEYVDPYPALEQIIQDPRTGQSMPVVNPYFKFKRHIRKMMKHGKESYQDEICSSGMDPHNPQPCLGCAAMDSGDKSISVSDQYALGILHLAYYHTHPMLDKATGQVVMRKDRNEPVLIEDECTGRLCNYCRIIQGQPPILQQGESFPNWRPQDLGTIFGKRRYLELGKSHLSDLFGWDEIISKQCGVCRQLLVIDAYACAFCGTTCINMGTDTRTDAEIKDAISKPFPCMRCQRGVPLTEVVACENCEKSQRKFLQLSLFDVVVFGMRQGESTKSHLVMGLGPTGVPYMTLEDFAKTIDPGWLLGKSIYDFVKEKAVPYDFAQVLRPRSIQEQAKHLELTIPGHAAPGAGYSPYGQPAGGPPQAQAAAGYPPAAHGGYQAPGMMPPGPVPTPAPYQAPAAPAPGPAAFVPPTQPNWGR